VAKRPHANSRRRHGPKPDRRRALELLAGSPDGMTEALLAPHGFTVEHMVELVRAGLATGVEHFSAEPGGERGYLWVVCPEPHLRPECEVYDSSWR
jgi:hypothetical protein